MDRDALWNMMVFLEVVERGTLAGAARALRVTPSAVSKQLARLEERLGVRLAHRTTRNLRLTPAGRRYADHAAKVVAALDDAEADVQTESGALRGRIRVTAPVLLGQYIVAPLVARFLTAHPEVEFDLDLSDRFVDLVAESVDIAVRVAPQLPASGLMAKKLGAIDWVLIASPAYVEQHGAPASASALADHACLELSHAQDRGLWELSVRGRTVRTSVRSPLSSSNILALHRCTLEGAGIARFPTYLVRADLDARRLVRVLPHVIASRRFVYALSPSRAHVPPRVRAFADMLGQSVTRALREP